MIKSSILSLMTNFLSTQQQEELELALKLERNAKYSDRIKCILLLNVGESESEIAHFLFMSLSTVENYYQRYQSGGVKELINDNHHGSKCYLTDQQLLELSDHLDVNLYMTVAAIREHISSKYEVEYSNPGTRHLLQRLGLTFLSLPTFLHNKSTNIAITISAHS